MLTTWTVIYDVAPSEWTNPAWMRSYEDAEPYATPSNNFGEGMMGLAPELGNQHQFQANGRGVYEGFGSGE
jgi:hypothetical protein